ncbi:MAG: type II secretion system F family protein [Candidatus Peregrinibacteria bacterium]|nr:type II secretion system F family protein [Candidatus Peregrinibacteria bacterium]
MANTTKTNFATEGTESFKLSNGKKGLEKAEKVILNIQEEKTGIIALEKRTFGDITLTGNPIVDTYRKINHYFVSHSSVSLEAKANFYHLLSVMINAGMPMVKALRSLVTQSANEPKLQMVINGIASDIEDGESLSESMLSYSDVFADQEIGMVESGEASGQLSRVLDNLAKDVEKAHSITGKVKGAMMYPTVVFVLLIGVVVAMLVLVIPKLQELFTSSGADLPLITKIVVALSDFFINQKFILIAGVLILIGAYSVVSKTDFGKYAIDKAKISIPIFGKLFRQAYLARFSRSLSNLLDSNISIVKTMEITANSIGNEVFRKKILLAMEDIKQGIPMAENLNDNDLFPPMLISMIDVGEKTAELDKIMAKVADFYENELDTSVAGISKIIEPVILIFIGVTVGTIVAAIMLPIMKLSDIAGTI